MRMTMTKDEALSQLCGKLVADPRIAAAGWSKVVLAGVVGDSHERIHGYRFDAQGRAQPVAPGDTDALDLLRVLRDAMAASDTARTPWVACLLKIEASGKVGADFEYADAARWLVTPANREQRVREFAAA
jgi:hypothetical protein